VQTVGIVGGGRAGLRLFQVVTTSSSMSVAFVVDVRSDAPAMQTAREQRVPVYSNPADALAVQTPSLVFEVTGDPDVAATVRELCSGRTEVVSAETARALLSAIDDSHRVATSQVVADVGSVKEAIERSLGEMKSLLDSIDTITSNMQMLALNARIEAARVGDEGRGFAVVAQEMAGSTELIRQAARQLEQLNGSVKGVSDGLDAALRRLA
jgi:methyl-accepting chemotaxis protein